MVRYLVCLMLSVDAPIEDKQLVVDSLTEAKQFVVESFPTAVFTDRLRKGAWRAYASEADLELGEANLIEGEEDGGIYCAAIVEIENPPS